MFTCSLSFVIPRVTDGSRTHTSCFTGRRAETATLRTPYIHQVVALRIELSATRLSAGYGQPALDYPVSPTKKPAAAWRHRVILLKDVGQLSGAQMERRQCVRRITGEAVCTVTLNYDFWMDRHHFMGSQSDGNLVVIQGHLGA